MVARPPAARHPAGRTRLIAIVACAALASACGGAARQLRPEPPPRAQPSGAPPPSHPPHEVPLARPAPLPPPPPPGLLAALPEETRRRLVAAAAGWASRSAPFVVGARRFRADCSGFVEAAYESTGIPLRDAVDVRPEDGGSTAAALHRASRSLGVLYGAEREPLPGDLVFFHDTYDRNRNGRVDDGITHAGLVERVLEDGTVVFLHRGSHGVARGRLHLGTPDLARDAGGAVRNSPLRARGRTERQGTPALAGQLFAGFGRIDPARVAAVLDGNERLDLAALGFAEGPPLGDLPLPAGGGAR